MNELKPCPFCGSEARGIVDGVVFCDCGADAPIEEWNRRVLQARRIGNSLRVVTQDEFPEVVEVVHDGNMRAYLSGQSRVVEQMDSQDTTQRELNAAIYYTWMAIDRIEDALITLKWMVEEGKDGKRVARELDEFHRSIRDIAAIRTKFYQEQLRIVMDDAVSAMEDSE